MTPHGQPVCALAAEPVTAVLTMVRIFTSPLRVLFFDRKKGEGRGDELRTVPKAGNALQGAQRLSKRILSATYDLSTVAELARYREIDILFGLENSEFEGIYRTF